MGDRGGARNFHLRGLSCSTNIFIKTTSHIHIYTCFFIIYTFFYLISYIYIYIYTHTQKKKSFVFSIKKLCLMAIFHKIKFIFTIFIVKFLKNVIFDTNYLIPLTHYVATKETFHV